MFRALSFSARRPSVWLRRLPHKASRFSAPRIGPARRPLRALAATSSLEGDARRPASLSRAPYSHGNNPPAQPREYRSGESASKCGCDDLGDCPYARIFALPTREQLSCCGVLLAGSGQGRKQRDDKENDYRTHQQMTVC